MKSTFRAWLVDRVSELTINKLPGESLEQRAKRLGVQPDVLTDAEKLRTERLGRSGRFARGRTISADAYAGYVREILLYFPPDIDAHLMAVCAARNLLFPHLGRAVIQTLLSGPDNPTWTGEGWMFRGKHYRTGRKSKQRRIVISVGAEKALTLRAERLGASRTGLVRGALIDMLEGRLTRLIYADVSSMWNDPNKYWTGELTSAGRYDWIKKVGKETTSDD